MSGAPRFERTQLLVDRDVQVSLIVRSGLYGLACVVYFSVVQFFAQAMIHPDMSVLDVFWSLADEAVYWVPGLLVLMPLMGYDMLRHSHRFAGPILSLKREMRRLSDQESGKELVFRVNDFWNCVAQDFNNLRQRVLLMSDENRDLRAKLVDLQEENKTLRDQVVGLESQLEPTPV